MDKVRVNISISDEGLTIKEYLKKHNVGRGKIEEIRVNHSSFINELYAPLETCLHENDFLSFDIREEIDFIPQDGSLDVVYEDDYFLAVNKPANMIIYPDSKEKKGTLVNLIANYYIKNNIHRKIRYLHRIDKETTGLILFAKDFLSEAILLKEFENHTIYRAYLALLEGKIKRKKGTISACIGQDRHINGKMCINNKGKNAISKYRLIKEYNNYSLVEFTLLTGRTHQIRVHASYFLNPLLGDVLYGGTLQYISRVALHSYKMRFIHPFTNKEVLIQAKLPNDINDLVNC